MCDSQADIIKLTADVVKLSTSRVNCVPGWSCPSRNTSADIRCSQQTNNFHSQYMFPRNGRVSQIQASVVFWSVSEVACVFALRQVHAAESVSAEVTFFEGSDGSAL